MSSQSPKRPVPAVQERLAQIETLQQSINEILAGEIIRADLRISARKDGEKYPLAFQFKFPPGGIPIELKDFLGVIWTDLDAEKSQLLTSRIMLVIGNVVVDLDDFVKDYAGENPSVEPDDIAALRALIPGQSVTIKINGEYTSIRRF